jgi:peptide/nickel transport system permease protein
MRHSLPAPVWAIGRTAVRLATRLPLIALCACTLLCLAPGLDSDERSLDLRLSAPSVAALRASHRGVRNPLAECAAYLAALAHGDLGESTTYGAPVLGLVRERWLTTFRSLFGGLLGGWILAGGSATLLFLLRWRAASFGAAALATVLICVPSALVGLVAMVLDVPVAAALAAVVFPRVYQYVGRVLARAAQAPHVVCAAGAGVTRWRLFCFACLPPALPELIAVAAASAGIALASLVPLEVICDSPGLGQLAWQATLGRDLPLLLSVTLAMAAAANLCGAAADTAIQALARSRT